MPKRVQRVGHAETQANLYIGLPREITVDTTNNEARVHDGATAGGTRMARQDLGNVAVATSGSDGKMSSTLFNNLAQVISDLDAAEVDITQNVADIGSNAADITTNTGNIAQNTSDIIDNTAAIAAHIADGDNPHSVTPAQLDLEIGIDVQAFNALLAAIAGLTMAANKLIYGDGEQSVALADFTSQARELLDDTSFAAMRTTLGLTNANAFNSALLHIRDEKTSGTAGGTFTAGAWRTRVLNTVKTNEITGAALATNQITLPAGTYYIDANPTAFDVVLHKAKLYNITDTADVIIGTSERASSASGTEHTIRSNVSGRFTIAAEKTFELQHICSVTKESDGFGIATSLGVEVYADVKIWKVA